MNTTAIVLGVIALGSLGINIWQLVINRRRAARETNADLLAMHSDPIENPSAPAGWQIHLNVQNRGGATAYNPAIWIADAHGEPLTHRYTDRGALAPGQPTRLGADLPRVPTGEDHVWIAWEDSRGLQERDTGIRV